MGRVRGRIEGINGEKRRKSIIFSITKIYKKK